MSDASSPQVRDHETREQRMDRRKTEPSGRTEKREITAVKKNLFVRRARQRERERERERERDDIEIVATEQASTRSTSNREVRKNDTRHGERQRKVRRRERKGVQEDGRGGRRSNEPTSHGVVSTRAPLPLSSFSSPLPTSLHLLLRPSSSTAFTVLLLLRPLRFSSDAVVRSFSRSFSPVPRLYIIHISTLVFGRLCGSTIIHTLFSSPCARRTARVTPGTCNLRGVRERYADRPATLCREAEWSFCLTFARRCTLPWKFASTRRGWPDGRTFDHREPLRHRCSSELIRDANPRHSPTTTNDRFIASEFRVSREKMGLIATEEYSDESSRTGILEGYEDYPQCRNVCTFAKEKHRMDPHRWSH